MSLKKLPQPIAVTKSFLPPIDEYIDQIREIWGTHWITNQGPLHERFIEQAQCYLKVPHVVPFVNGHLALDIAIKTLELRGNVITTPFTFASTTHALVMNGLEPKFCDISLADFTIDAGKIEELIDGNTSAIVPVHIFGYPCNVAEIGRIAKKYNLKVIYDAAHVFGVEKEGVGIGNYGDASMFSLHATKVLHSIEGGLLSFNNPEYRAVFNLYKNFGIIGPEDVVAVGLNAKMNEFQAAMGLVNLRHLQEECKKRKEIVNTYRIKLADVPGIYFLEDIPGVKHNYAYFPILVDEHEYGMNRNELHDRLQEYNVFPRKYFYPLTPDFQCFGGRYSKISIPNARLVANRVMTLPLYGDLGVETARQIADIIARIRS